MLDSDWEVYEPCGTEYLHKISNAALQKRIKSNIWCVKPGNKHYILTEHEHDMFAVHFDCSEQTELDYIEFLFNTKKDGYFLYARNHSIRRSLDATVFHVDGIPCLAPEIVLLYKSTAADNAEYRLDFYNTIENMSIGQSTWLAEALSTVLLDGHEWPHALCKG
jgi:hypothetical protein